MKLSGRKSLHWTQMAVLTFPAAAAHTWSQIGINTYLQSSQPRVHGFSVVHLKLSSVPGTTWPRRSWEHLIQEIWTWAEIIKHQVHVKQEFICFLSEVASHPFSFCLTRSEIFISKLLSKTEFQTIQVWCEMSLPIDHLLKLKFQVQPDLTSFVSSWVWYWCQDGNWSKIYRVTGYW